MKEINDFNSNIRIIVFIFRIEFMRNKVWLFSSVIHKHYGILRQHLIILLSIYIYYIKLTNSFISSLNINLLSEIGPCTVHKGCASCYFYQGCNARKVISEVYAFFVLQCTVFGRKSKHKTDVTDWHGIHFYKNNLWNILVIGNYYVNYQNYQNWMLLSSSDARRTLMHLFLFTNSAQRELVSISTQSIHNRN